MTTPSVSCSKFTCLSPKMFVRHVLSLSEDIFQKLSEANAFETFSNGRQGAIIADRTEDGWLPIVRSTSSYSRPSQDFAIVHLELAHKIKEAIGDETCFFNNAMVEIYQPSDRKMKYHSDLSLDLSCSSYIALFSCYEKGTSASPRQLLIKSKATNLESKIDLEHNSVVVFSVATNGAYLHKIVGGNCSIEDGKWLGVTFRQSKTFIREQVGQQVFQTTGRTLRKAAEDEKLAFFKHKSKENAEIGYIYPEIDYTLSEH